MSSEGFLLTSTNHCDFQTSVPGSKKFSTIGPSGLQRNCVLRSNIYYLKRSRSLFVGNFIDIPSRLR